MNKQIVISVEGSTTNVEWCGYQDLYEVLAALGHAQDAVHNKIREGVQLREAIAGGVVGFPQRRS